MVDEQGAVIIRDAEGTEHEFPAGFDPKKAAGIVRARAGAGADFGPATPAAAPPVDRGGLAHPMTSFAAPELEAVRGTLNAATAVPAGQPYMARSRTGAMYPSETGTGAVNAAKSAAKGFGGELINQAEGITSPLGIAAMGAGKGVSALAKSPEARGIVGRTLRMISDFDVRKPFKSTVGLASDALEGSAVVPQTLQDARMGVTRGADMYQMPRAQTVVERAPRAAQTIGEAGAATPEAAAPTGATGLSPADRASLVKQGMSPEGIAKLEQQMGGAAPAQITGSLRMAPPSPAGPPLAGSLPEPLPAIEPPANWKTAVPDQVGHALDPARVDIGAEATGRAAGLTKQQVRDVATPILDAAPGEASPILPEAALKRMVDTLKAMPKGGPEREAYVARATSGKTQWQVENIRRTLEHLGLIVPIAAAGSGTVRDEVMRRLRGSQQPGQQLEQ